MVVAYREPDQGLGRGLRSQLIESLSNGVPPALQKAISLGRTLTKRAADVLADFDHPGTSNGPTAAINGRPEPELRATARAPGPTPGRAAVLRQ